MSQVPPDPELTAIESALRGLAPARSRLDCDRLMFQAGQASIRPRSLARWAWPSIAASLAIVAVSEALLLASRPAPHLVAEREGAPSPREQPEPVVILSQAPAAPRSHAGPWWPGGSESLRLHRQALRFGLDGLPEPPPLLSHVAGRPRSPGAPSESPEMWRRVDYQKLLDPGGPS
jgi:hypothetical protein